ncbi:hypothetical protein GPALN_011736 [Globodera pallida]|nr:hypothetical protein GPALN_011736 [Globodera pallida]
MGGARERTHARSNADWLLDGMQFEDARHDRLAPIESNKFEYESLHSRLAPGQLRHRRHDRLAPGQLSPTNLSTSRYIQIVPISRLVKAATLAPPGSVDTLLSMRPFVVVPIPRDCRFIYASLPIICSMAREILKTESSVSGGEVSCHVIGLEYARKTYEEIVKLYNNLRSHFVLLLQDLKIALQHH